MILVWFVNNAPYSMEGPVKIYNGGSGDSGGSEGTGVVDSNFSSTSDNALKNKVLTEVLAKKDYSAENKTGLGIRLFRTATDGTTLPQNSFETTNTIYIIKYDFDLDGEELTIGANSIIIFDGGTLSNGTLIGDDTTIRAGITKIFGNNITLEGTWNVKEGYPQWFGCFPNDDTIDTTPAIQKLVAVGIPIYCPEGIYYLSECLLHGKKTVVIRGTGSHYKTGTTFKAFYPNSAQRFILKLGGNADFSVPAVYRDSWCSNFILDGINFNTRDTTLVNAYSQSGINPTNVQYEQNYAAVCFDWCVEGYVNIRHEGACPGVFIANSWEIYFESIVLYESTTTCYESALYFGRAYPNFEASNISAITINNIFGENIHGKLIDCYSYYNSANNIMGCNMTDVIINNIEFEPLTLASNVYLSGANAHNYIVNDIRNIDVIYFINITGHCTINSIMACFFDAILKKAGSNTDVSNLYTRGVLKSNYADGRVVLGKYQNPMQSNTSAIFGATNDGTLVVKNVEIGDYNNNNKVYNKSAVVEDFTNNNTGLAASGVVIIERTNSVCDMDSIKVIPEGLLLDCATLGKVDKSIMSVAEAKPLTGLIEGSLLNLIRFANGHTISSKFKFKGTHLVFNYIAPNQYANVNITVTYYYNRSVAETDSIKLEPSDTSLMSYEYQLYTENYDYCTIKFNTPVCIYNIMVKDLSILDREDKVLMFPKDITTEVKGIMANYAENDAYKETALQYFFNKIGTIKTKLNHLLLPIFAKDLTEAVYDVITGQPFNNVDGNNPLSFDNTYKRLSLTTAYTQETYRQATYEMFSGNVEPKGLTILVSNIDNQSIGHNIYGARVSLNGSGYGFFESFGTNSKIIGCGLVDDGGTNCYIRLGDSKGNDKVTIPGSTTPSSFWNSQCQIFGNKPEDTTYGTRILVSTAQILTVEEAKTLRDAVIALDNKYFNRNA